MTTHSDHIDADHESQSDSHDLVNQFLAHKAPKSHRTIAVVLLPL